MFTSKERQKADIQGRLIAYTISVILWLFFLATLLHIIPDFFSLLN